MDTNTNDHRCDFVAYQQDGLAARLHPSSKMDAMPVVGYPGPWCMDWTMDGGGPVNALQRVGQADPAAARGQHAPEEHYLNFSIVDKVSAAAFVQYLNMHDPHDVTHPNSTQGHVCLPWQNLSATHGGLMPVLREQIRRVWTCRTTGDDIGLLVQMQDDRLVLVKCERGKLVSHAEADVLATVVVPW